MFVRMTFISIKPEHIEESKRMFQQEIVPAVRQQKGNENIMLLEPTDESDQYISLTIWQSREDAQQYETSGKYKELVDKARHTFSKPPVLKSYTVA